MDGRIVFADNDFIITIGTADSFNLKVVDDGNEDEYDKYAVELEITDRETYKLVSDLSHEDAMNIYLRMVEDLWESGKVFLNDIRKEMEFL